jgi:hypothetical protein
MSSQFVRWPIVACSLIVLVSATARAEEPNESFAARTLLPGGTLSVFDDLTPGLLQAPDTLLGIKGTFGEIEFIDDDGSNLGNGYGSGVVGAPTNSGSIDFCVTGVGDDGFVGAHGISGDYLVVVDVYDFFGDYLESFTADGTLAPGVVNDYSFNNFEWIGGSYDVNINNITGNVMGGDLDFFTFTDLTPGVAYAAETFQPIGSNIDTILGRYDDSGELVEFSDDLPDGSVTSQIEGVVPASGVLTFAVTGYPDEQFLGEHTEDATYELRLTLPSAADFNGDGDVDRNDLLQWQGDFALNGDSDADGDNDSDGADLLTWQRELTPALAAAAQTAVPEPINAPLILVAAALLIRRRRT